MVTAEPRSGGTVGGRSLGGGGNLLEKSKSISEAIGFKEGIAWCFDELGLVATRHGDPKAEAMLRTSLELHRELGD